MENTSKIVIAAVAGAAAGAVVALLFAPDTGTEFRHKIKDGAQKFTDELKNQFQEGMKTFNKTKEQMKDYVGTEPGKA